MSLRRRRRRMFLQKRSPSLCWMDRSSHFLFLKKRRLKRAQLSFSSLAAFEIRAASSSEQRGQLEREPSFCEARRSKEWKHDSGLFSEAHTSCCPPPTTKAWSSILVISVHIFQESKVGDYIVVYWEEKKRGREIRCVKRNPLPPF